MDKPGYGAPIDGKNVLSWPTLILILLTGGGNFFATQQKGDNLSYEQRQALEQIRHLHDALDEFEARQKEILEKQNRILSELKKP